MQARNDCNILGSGPTMGQALAHFKSAHAQAKRACGIVKRMLREINFLPTADCRGNTGPSPLAAVYRFCLPLCVIAITYGTLAITSRVACAATASDPQAHASTALQRRVAVNVGYLASDRWKNRQRAERSLLSTKGFVLPQLAAAMVKAKNPEQRDRLLRICMQLYLRQFNWLHHGSAFIGVEFIAKPLELRRRGIPKWIPAVAVVRTVAGFPGGLYLRENDLILGINGHTISAYNTATAFRAEIQQHQPGSVITLLLLRNGKMIKVPVRLTGIPTDPLAAQELLNQRNLIAQHLIDKYLPVKPLVLAAAPR